MNFISYTKIHLSMSKAKALSIGCSLTDFKKGCHSEFVTCPTQVGRTSGGGNRFLVRRPAAELVEACGGRRMTFLPNYHYLT